MATWVAGTALALTFGTSHSANAPAGLSDGDLLLAAVVCRDATITPPAGWTTVETVGPYDDGATFVWVTVFRKTTVVGATDSSASFTFSQTTSGRLGIVYAAVTDFADIAEVVSSTDPAYAVDFTFTPDSLTATDDDEIMIVFGSLLLLDDLNLEAQSPTPQSGFTLFSGTGDTRQSFLVGAYKSLDTGQSNSGTFNTHPTWTDADGNSPFDNPGSSITIRISPSGGSGITGYAELPGLLNTSGVLALGDVEPIGQASAPSMLGIPAAAASHDFTGALANVPAAYVMDLITPTGTVRVPISSWQATLQTGAKNYVQCVIPAAGDYIDDINDATDFSILRRAELADGTAIEGWMAGAPITNIQAYQGAERYTVTLSGYSDAFAENEDPAVTLDRDVTGVRSVSSSNGTARARCDIDWLLRPGQRAYVSGDPMLIGWINYYVNGSDAFMDIGEASEASS